MVDLRYTPITELAAVSGVNPNLHPPPGFERDHQDLNKGRERAPYIFLCAKRQGEEEEGPGLAPITDITLTYVAHDAGPTANGATVEGFVRLTQDLNVGGRATDDKVYLHYKREPDASPITDFRVIYDDDKCPDGFRKIAVDVNRGLSTANTTSATSAASASATKVFLCYRRDSPIRDVRIADQGVRGFSTFIDSDIAPPPAENNDLAAPQPRYVCHTDGGSHACVTGIHLVDDTDGAKARAAALGWEYLGPADESLPLRPRVNHQEEDSSSSSTVDERKRMDIILEEEETGTGGTGTGTTKYRQCVYLSRGNGCPLL
jgi:hypothetical protein